MSGPSGGRIPDSFIEALLAKTDIVSVIQESIKLKKNGANYSACCPFHHEKTPSFTVSQTKQFYHCFGCSAHGDAIRFLMDYQSLSFVDAVEQLAARLGMSVPKDPVLVAKAQVKQSTTSVLKRSADFYADLLKNHIDAKLAHDYLKKRGLTGQVAKAFQLGFAPKGWDNLLSHFSKEADALKVLEETGLIIRHKEGRLYDRFRERIMFPIRDRKGDVIGFGARVMDKSQPKYLNSPESPIFQKSHCLYGIYEALKTKQKWQTAIVVEGYMDVVALSQMGVHGAVATLGTAITSHHLTTLFHLVDEIVFCFDGDKAGMGAAWKALQLVLGLLQEGRKVSFVFLPQGEDPDSYVRQQGKEAFLGLVKNGTPLSEYFFATLSEKIKPNSVDSRAHLASIARPLIETIPPGIFKEMMYEQLANIVSSTPQVVRGEKAFRSYYSPKGQTKLKVAPPPQPMETAYIASALLLREPNLYTSANTQATFNQEIKAPGMELFYFLCTLLSSDPLLSSLQLRQKLLENNFDVNRLKECENKVAILPLDGLEAEFCGALKRLEVIGREQTMEKLILKAKISELSEEEKKALKEFLQFRESIG
ncbi:MAG: DNA primase [Proteobacteria bacterium]|nr:DNA primase [Pseudomonadota bacterium]